MKSKDRQLGQPSVLYKDTQANIEALAGAEAGAVAYATDTEELGTFDGTTWVWGQGVPPQTLTAATLNASDETGHTHQVSASSDPGPTESLLKTDSGGGLILDNIQVTGDTFIGSTLSMAGDYYTIHTGTNIIADNVNSSIIRIMTTVANTPWSGWLRLRMNFEPSGGSAYASTYEEWLIPIRWYWEGGSYFPYATPTRLVGIDTGSKTSGYMDIGLSTLTTYIDTSLRGIWINVQSDVNPNPGGTQNVRINWVAEFFCNNPAAVSFEVL